jgi:competence ComEA-like helix-hairpin-helix protein
LPEQLREVVLMQPTGKTLDSLPEMEIIVKNTELYNKTMANIENSFVNEFLDLYFIAQIYLNNTGAKSSIEPAYIALTENQGGFAKFGFSLKNKGVITVNPNTPYVDITIGQATNSADRLMSFTQLYPHEMGHILVHLLCPEDSVSNNTKNVDMHFFSIITDYSTAFNEGFSEHIENVARTYETNETIKEGIIADIRKIDHSTKYFIKGFERDFKYPFRLGYYKASMLNWYQKYEDLKRHKHAFNGDIRYKNKTLKLANKEDQLTFRNSGVGLNKNEKRNLVQLHASEGAISAFFTHLSTSGLQNEYLDVDFYLPFIYNYNEDTLNSPELVFTPLQNQFIKYFYVLHNYVVFNNSSKSQFADFIDGYIQTFPSEKKAVYELFEKSLGATYSNELPPPLWLMVRDHPHRLLVFDPFDAITVPIYTFDLNAAETEDLQTIKGVSAEAAKKIVEYRTTNGFFTEFEQLKSIPGLSKTAVDNILSSQLEESVFEEVLKDFDPKLSIEVLISKPLHYIYTRAIFYFLLMFAFIYMTLIRPVKPTIKKVIWLFIKYFLLWVTLVLAGLISVFMSAGNPYLISLVLFILTSLTGLLIYRKRKYELKRTLVFIGSMGFLIFISIF